MKAGQSLDCPRCGRNSFLKKESVLDGWVKKGEVLKCASCGAVIERLQEETASSAAADDDAGKEKKNALAALLGEDDTSTASASELLKEEKRFCRDCAYRIATAFRMRCGKHDRDVNPMDDCPDYVPRG